MKKLQFKLKTSTIALILLLTISSILVTLPAVSAQTPLVMNISGDPLLIELHNEVDIDLNGGPGPGQNVSLFVKYPGRTEFTFIDTYLTTTTGPRPGDLDVYDFDFNETGNFQLKWAYPPDSPYYPSESNVGNVNVVLEILWTSYPFIGALPNPVGVNQQVLLHVGITEQLRSAQYGWENLSVTIEKPDGSTEIISDIRTDSTGGTGTVYVPTMVGTYYLQTNFPKQSNPGSLRGGTWIASSSEKLALVVQAEPLDYYPGQPLPTEYWTRPIDAQLREWSPLAGSSWMDNDYNEAPETAHILWTKPLTIGGLVGGERGEYGFEHGDAYQGKFSSRIIIAGILIYTHDTNIRPLVYTAVNLRTGEELWQKTFLDNRTISRGQLFFWDSYNYHGTFAYLWVTVGNDWYSFDPFTGEPRYSMKDVPSGSNVIGEKGEIYRYNVNLSDGYMTLWNSSALGSMQGSWAPSGGFGGNIYTELDAGSGFAAARAYSWNISIPTGLPGSVRGVKLGDRVVGARTGSEEINMWGFSLKPGQEGTLLYNTTWQFPPEWIAGNINFAQYGTSWALTDMDSKIALVWAKELRKHYAFSLETGLQLWEQEIQHPYLDIYSIGRRIKYGRLYSVGQAGQVHCWNATTGKLLWIYNATDPYTEFLWGNHWSLDLQFISEEKLYFFHSEHSPVNPLFRGAPAVCLDAITGDEIWRADGLFRKTDWGGSPIMGDSVIAMYNSYDQCVYAIGKGPSEITASIQNDVVKLGSSAVIKGTVMDISPGTNDLKLRFPKGVPAVSDESMSEWMKYVYKQLEKPVNTIGVDVKIEIVDPAGGYAWIGTTKTDVFGNYAYSFIPQMKGQYLIMATFSGSGGYYGSTTTTYLMVDPAPTDVNLAPVQGSVNEVKGSVNTLDSSVNDLEGCVNDLETSVSDLSSLESSVNTLEGSTTGFEASLNNLESSIANQSTFIIAILALVVIAIAIAAYSVIKTRK